MLTIETFKFDCIIIKEIVILTDLYVAVSVEAGLNYGWLTYFSDLQLSLSQYIKMSFKSYRRCWNIR